MPATPQRVLVLHVKEAKLLEDAPDGSPRILWAITIGYRKHIERVTTTVMCDGQITAEGIARAIAYGIPVLDAMIAANMAKEAR